MVSQQFTAIVEREGGGYVSICPELDIASQRDTVAVAEAHYHLIEAVQLFFEVTSALAVRRQMS